MTEPKDPAHLLPLKRLAPSRFAAAAECPLREVLRTNSAPRLLPTNGVAHLGTVVHRLLEDAAGAPGMTPECAEERFAELCAEEEAHMEGTPDAIFRPLQEHVRDFGVRKRRAVLAAVARSATASGSAPQPAAGPRTLGPEVWVQTADGAVGGYIDDVVREGSAIVLRDYKSGIAAQAATAAHAAAMQQLHLYSALYAAMHGIWPAAVEIVPVDGEPLRETVDRAACEALLRKAVLLFRWTNSILASTAAPTAAAQLGRPAPAACRWCEFRPVCSAYRTARKEPKPWPSDAIGVVAAVAHLGNGKLSAQIREPTGTAHVRGITPGPARHPQLSALVPGAVAGLFNLRGSAGRYEESPQTAIVIYESGT